MKKILILLILAMIGAELSADREAHFSEVRTEADPATSEKWPSHPDSVAAEPLIVFAADEFDMGEAPVGEKLSIDIPFTNGGDAPLVLTSVYSDCSCVKARYPKEEIAPGDSAHITVTFNSANRPATPFRKMVRVRSNARNSFRRIYVYGILK